eukprot:Skav227951  [mRNA]  locus=scaffold146:636511:639147:- [translate_table: standard]
MSGLITDVKKAFNCLPRQVIIACAHHFGLHPQLISGWHRAIARIERFFIVEGACSQACLASCGYPEGDPLSVVAMFLLNQAMHGMLQSQVTPCRIISYVDNWEVVSSQPEQIIQAKTAMTTFAEDVHLTLDAGKTHCWSLDPNGRQLFRRAMEDVRYDVKDLGGHVVFCKRATIHTITSRIKASGDLWTWLARSMSPDKHKLQVLSSVAWPRCFHGISSLRIGIAHVKKLRSAAMGALGWDKRGANSALQFGISPFPKADPGFYILWETISDFRVHHRSEYAFLVLDHLALGPPKHSPQGPGAAVLQHLHMLGWRWVGDGYVVDHEHLRWSLVEEAVQWVFLRLTHAWAAHTGGFMQTRAGFEGLADVDRTVTFAKYNSWSVERKGILRTGMNGTFYTNDALIHSGKVSTKCCSYCGHPDSKYHRLWECPRFQSIRNAIPWNAQQDLRSQPACFSVHGWILETVEVKHFRELLWTIPDTTLDWQNPGRFDTLHFFTDGACLHPKNPAARLATWAVCVANLEDDTFPLLSAGGVVGGLHTALRGEITAAISAITYALDVSLPFTVWLDNETVYHFLDKCRAGLAKHKTARQKNHDLWNQLLRVTLLAISRDLFCGVVKVQSHAEILPDTPLVERWALRGNQAADLAASGALLTLPTGVVQGCHRAQSALETAARRRDFMHQLIVGVGEQAILDPIISLPAAEEPVGAPEEGPVDVSFQPFVTLPCPEFPGLGTSTDSFMQWLQALVQAEHARPLWVTSYHLLAHWQMTMKSYGFRERDKRWEVVEDLNSFDGQPFIKCSRWFSSLLKAISQFYQMEYHSANCKPDGNLFANWCRCVRLPMEMATLLKVEQGMTHSRGGSIRAVKTYFGDVDSFILTDIP